MPNFTRTTVAHSPKASVAPISAHVYLETVITSAATASPESTQAPLFQSAHPQNATIATTAPYPMATSPVVQASAASQPTSQQLLDADSGSGADSRRPPKVTTSDSKPGPTSVYSLAKLPQPTGRAEAAHDPLPSTVTTRIALDGLNKENHPPWPTPTSVPPLEPNSEALSDSESQSKPLADQPGSLDSPVPAPGVKAPLATAITSQHGQPSEPTLVLQAISGPHMTGIVKPEVMTQSDRLKHNPFPVTSVYAPLPTMVTSQIMPPAISLPGVTLPLPTAITSEFGQPAEPTPVLQDAVSVPQMTGLVELNLITRIENLQNNPLPITSVNDPLPPKPTSQILLGGPNKENASPWPTLTSEDIPEPQATPLPDPNLFNALFSAPPPVTSQVP